MAFFWFVIAVVIMMAIGYFLDWWKGWWIPAPSAEALAKHYASIRRKNDIMNNTLPEGFNSVSDKPENDKAVFTTTLWCGEWVLGNAVFRDGQYYNICDLKRMIDTPSGWKY